MLLNFYSKRPNFENSSEEQTFNEMYEVLESLIPNFDILSDSLKRFSVWIPETSSVYNEVFKALTYIEEEIGKNMNLFCEIDKESVDSEEIEVYALGYGKRIKLSNFDIFVHNAVYQLVNDFCRKFGFDRKELDHQFLTNYYVSSNCETRILRKIFFNLINMPYNEDVRIVARLEDIPEDFPSAISSRELLTTYSFELSATQKMVDFFKDQSKEVIFEGSPMIEEDRGMIREVLKDLHEKHPFYTRFYKGEFVSE